MLRKIYKALFLIFLSVTVANAQNTGSIKGKVIDKTTGEPLPFANVIAETNGQQAGGAQTDFDGNFTIKPLAPGKYDIKASFIGYTAGEVTGIIVSTDKITYQDMKLAKGIDITAVEVTEYSIPLIDKGNTTVQKTITQEEIEVAPTRDVKSIAATTAGVTQKDEGDALNVRGSRSEATDYYVDGVRVRGNVRLPQQGIEQITVVTGGVPAQYGDNTGGLINITTRGPAKEFAGGVELVSSELFDSYGYNLGGANVSGPLWSRKDEAGKKGRTIAGFFIAGEYQTEKDPDPAAIDLYKVKDDKYKEITENPLVPSEAGLNFDYATNYIRQSDLEIVKHKQNIKSTSYRFNGKITVSPVERVDLVFGGNYDRNDRSNFNWNFALFNSDFNSNTIETNWNAFGRITQRFGSGTADKDKSASAIKNAYYSLQFDVSKQYTKTQNTVHEDRFFDYGYVGKFTQTKAPLLLDLNQFGAFIIVNGDTFHYLHVANADNQYIFTPGNVNPIMQNYTTQVYNALNGNIINQGDLANNNGMYNGVTPDVTYSMWNSPGTPSGTYQITDLTNYRATLSGSADIKNHAISVGFEFEQRIDRGYAIIPTSIWVRMRALANKYYSESLDGNSPIFDGDTIFFPTVTSYDDGNGRAKSFYERVRERLGVANHEFVDIDSYDRSLYSLDLFTPDDLLGDGSNTQFIQQTFGYDYLGNKLSSQPSYKDFFKDKDDEGNFTRKIDAFRPVYTAGYIQDNFAINDLHFNIGLRVDRFDANQKVAVDPYSLYPTRKAGEMSGLNSSYVKPSSIGDDFVVYVNNITSPTVEGIVGYRDGQTWYNNKGEVIADPKSLATAAGGKIAPFLVNTNLVNNGTQRDDFDPDQSFKDYDPQVTVMPRIAFSFPISDEALFYAHYDILTQRPSARLRNDPVAYLFMPVSQGTTFNNPSMKPERTTDYEIGFSQKLTASSALSISAFYRELRDQVQQQYVAYAFPVDYVTYGNIDFGTVKGLTFSYDLRRTGNVRMTLAYTLQFADGTGSDDASSARLVALGQPYLRAIFPFNYDQRHNIVASIDYRYGSGKDYNGPMWFGTQFFQNTGVNFLFKVNSGTPYTRQSDAVTAVANIGVQQAGQGSLSGTINGSRLPWQSRIDVKLDRDIELKFGKKGDKVKTANLNIYIQVQNLLDAKNIISVYRYTGAPEDDGYLASGEGQQNVANQVDPEAYVDMYEIKANNPDNYSIPRRMRLGVRFDF